MQRTCFMATFRAVLSYAETSDDVLRALGTQTATIAIRKESIGWNLESLEVLTQQDSARDEDSDDESEEEVERMLP